MKFYSENKPAEAGPEHSLNCRLLLLVSCLASSSTLEMEATCSAEAAGSLRTTHTLQSHCSENFSYNRIITGQKGTESNHEVITEETVDGIGTRSEHFFFKIPQTSYPGDLDFKFRDGLFPTRNCNT
jgi:hypothetical protein